MSIKKVYICICLGLGLLLAACAGGAALSNVENRVSVRATRPVETVPAGAREPYVYRNAEGSFSLRLPGDWTVSQPRPTTLGHLYLLRPAQPGAAGISVLVGNAGLESDEAALRYLCPDCPAETLQVEPVALGGQPASQARLAGQAAPDLAWYLVEHNGRVLVFTLHAPAGAGLDQEILQTLRLTP